MRIPTRLFRARLLQNRNAAWGGKERSKRDPEGTTGSSTGQGARFLEVQLPQGRSLNSAIDDYAVWDCGPVSKPLGRSPLSTRFRPFSLAR